MALHIPLIAVPAQSLTVNLSGQQCEIVVAQKGEEVFMSLRVNSVQVLTNSICRDRVDMVRQEYLPFVGQLAFVDTQGTNDPDYTGFGARYKLAYIP